MEKIMRRSNFYLGGEYLSYLHKILSNIFLCFYSKKQLGILDIWPIHKGRHFLRTIYSKNIELTKIIVKAQINQII